MDLDSLVTFICVVTEPRQVRGRHETEIERELRQWRGYWVKSAGRLEHDLERLVDAISSVEGVVAIILFGSRARGDHDESSDYDLLTIFKDDQVMWKNHRTLYEKVSKLGLFTQVLARTIEEFKEKTEPTFLQTILSQGILLYARYPFTLPATAEA